jgi:hypothetical protein
MSKRLYWFFILLFISPFSFGQQTREEDGILPIKVSAVKWSKETATISQNQARPPYTAPERGRQDPLTSGNLNRPGPPRSQTERISFYLYSAKFTNLGKKPIKAVAWDYRVTDSATSEELSNHPFRSYTKIGANRAVTLMGRSSEPPSRVVSAAAGEKGKSIFLEQVIIKCVIFSDETLWKNPFSPNSDCQELKIVDENRQYQKSLLIAESTPAE